MGYDLFNRGHAGVRLHGKNIAHRKEHQFSFRAHDGVEAAPRLVEALKCPEKTFNAVRGARIRIVSEGWLQAVEFVLRLRDPCLQATVLSAVLRG